MTPQKKASLRIKGLKVRTNSQTEMTNQGRVRPLWESFHEIIGPQLQFGDPYYGVYCHMNADVYENFDVIVGISEEDFVKNDIQVSEEMSEVTLEEGEYLSFSAVGTLPQATLRTWQQIRQYFNEHNCPYRRVYKTDFEHYIAPDVTKIYISVARK